MIKVDEKKSCGKDYLNSSLYTLIPERDETFCFNFMCERMQSYIICMSAMMKNLASENLFFFSQKKNSFN